MVSHELRPPAHETEVVLRDLYGLLRKKLGENLIVDSYTTTNLVPVGENYGSTMLKLDAEVRRDGVNSKPEKLYLVAKMSPLTEYQKTLFDSPVTFPKEIYMFTDIVPAYRGLERECGIPENEVFDLLPELYGARLSLDEANDKFGNDSAILMENLKVKNYFCGDRINGLDLPHARSVVEALARFHTLSIAIKIKKPKLFEGFKNRACFPNYTEDFTKVIVQFLLRNAQKTPSLLSYMPRIEKVVSRPNAIITNRVPVEPWSSIIHTDLWVTNVMFRDDASGNPEDVKFVDFQNYAYGNPMRDLVFFLFTSCKKEVRTASIEDLVDLYYETFISHLSRLKCDTSLFSRKAFDEQFADAANAEYVNCAFRIRFTIMDHENDPAKGSGPEEVFGVEATDEYREHMAEFTLKCINENWI